MNLLISDAMAQTGGGAFGSLAGLLPMVLIFVVFYLLLIRPQQKRQKEHTAMVAALQKGDEVLTSGGVLGKVTKAGEAYINLEIASGVTVKMQRGAVSQVLPKGTLKE